MEMVLKNDFKRNTNVAKIDIMFFFIYVMALLPAIICSVARFLLLLLLRVFAFILLNYEEKCVDLFYSSQGVVKPNNGKHTERKWPR